MSEEFQRENDELAQSFLERTFFKGWREGIPNFDRVELYLTDICNLDCTYCYLSSYGKELFSYKPYNPKKTLQNGKMFIDWLVENDYTPNFDIFSGEPSIRPEFYELTRYIVDKFKDRDRKPSITVPTNYSFLLSKSLTKKMEDLLEYGWMNGVRIYLSASFDGKYMEKNRPFKGHPKVDPRDDNFYEKAFEFNKKWGFGFHPMIYSYGIKDWLKNFLWFQEMFRRHDIPFHNIYLLEVRNPEWDDKQLREFYKFIRFLVDWSWNYLGRDPKKFEDFIFRLRGFNILNIFSTIGRGIGCSIQSLLTVRLLDLTLVPCHRTSYNVFELAKFTTDGKKITGIKALNPEMLITIYTFDAKEFPYCESCPIKHICPHGCLGAQYEFTGDLFTPFPQLCKLELTRMKGVVDGMKSIGMLNRILRNVDNDVRRDVRWVENELSLPW